MNADILTNEERLDSAEFRIGEMERQFKEAFPNGDYTGHCRYHLLMIESIEERRRLRRAIMEKTIAGLAWAVIVALGLAVWQWFKAQVFIK